MATLDSSPPNTEPETDTDLDTNPNSSHALVPVPTSPPVVCFVSSLGNAAAGAVVGSVIGFGYTLLKREGFKASLAGAKSSAKTYAVMSAVHGLVVCLLKWVRGRDDIYNQGIAGCCTGLSLSFPGPPQALLQSCLGFGAFTLVMERLNSRQAWAHTQSMNNKSIKNTFRYNGPPTLALPLPEELKGAFAAFCQSLKKPKGIFPTAQ